MTHTVKTNASTLTFLCNATPQQRKALLKTADKKLVRCICECVYNILHGNVPLSKKQKNKLIKHKYYLRNLCKKGENLKKKKIVLQKGAGIIPLILTPILTSLLGKFLP